MRYDLEACRRRPRLIAVELDGKRFVGISQAREGETQAAGALAPQIQVVEHWFEELKARVK